MKLFKRRGPPESLQLSIFQNGLSTSQENFLRQKIC